MAKSGLLGKKIGMTQIFKEGDCVPVTVVQVGPCAVTQKKQVAAKSAVQIGFEELPERKANKPYLNHFKKLGNKPYRYLKEFSVLDESVFNLGQMLDIKVFIEGDMVDVVGTSKGRGFQGVIKLHGFAGGPAAHGSRFHRTTGSIGQRASPGEVKKGAKMPGRMGCDTVTVRNLKIVAIRPEENLLLVRGALPGANGDLVFVALPKNIFEERVRSSAQAVSA